MNRIFPLLLIIVLLVAGCSKGQPDTTGSTESDSPSTENRVSDPVSEADTTTFELDPDAEVWRMHPQWAWYGSRIVFYEQRGSSSQIVVIDSNGNELVRTKASRGYAANPTWNDFGTEIAYSYAAEGVDGEWDLWRMNSDGTNPQLYIDLDDRVMHPAWDPTDAMLDICIVGDAKKEGFRCKSTFRVDISVLRAMWCALLRTHPTRCASNDILGQNK